MTTGRPKFLVPAISSRIHDSSFRIQHSFRCAFTLIEMLTTVAALVIVLGLMVSLAQHVRQRSGQQLTRGLLRQLDLLMQQYETRYHRMPPVDPLLPPTTSPTDVSPDESPVAAAALLNNSQWLRAINQDARRRRKPGLPVIDPIDAMQLPIGVYDHRTLRDAWGGPIVFMPGRHSLIGMAPSRGGQDQAFFFSAGPDRKYLTREDNLYSYESPQGIIASNAPQDHAPGASE